MSTKQKHFEQLLSKSNSVLSIKDKQTIISRLENGDKEQI